MVKPNAIESRRIVRRRPRDIRLADLEEKGAKATDEFLDHHLEERAQHEGVENTQDGIVGVPETADAELGQEDEADGDDGRDEA